MPVEDRPKNLAGLRREAESRVKEAQYLLNLMRVERKQQVFGENNDFCAGQNNDSESLVHSRLRSVSQREQVLLAHSALSPTKRLELRKREVQESEVNLDVHKAQLELRWLQRDAKTQPSHLVETFKQSQDTSGVGQPITGHQWRHSTNQKRTNAARFSTPEERRFFTPEGGRFTPEGGHLTKGSDEYSPSSLLHPPSGERSNLLEVPVSAHHFTEMHRRYWALEDGMRAATAACASKDRECARRQHHAAQLAEDLLNLQGLHDQLAEQNSLLVVKLTKNDTEASSDIAMTATVERLRKSNAQLVARLDPPTSCPYDQSSLPKESNAQRVARLDQSSQPRRLGGISPSNAGAGGATQREMDFEILTERAANQAAQIERLGGECTRLEAEAFELAVGSAELERQLADATSSSACLRTGLGDLMSEKALLERQVQQERDTCRMHQKRTRRLEVENEMYRRRCEAMEEELLYQSLPAMSLSACHSPEPLMLTDESSTPHIDDPPSSSEKISSKSEPISGKSEQISSKSEPISSQSESIRGKLDPISGKSNHSDQSERSDQLDSRHPMAKGVEFYVAAAAHGPCDTLRLQRNQKVQNSIGERGGGILFSDLVFENVSATNNDRLDKSALVVVASTNHIMPADDSRTADGSTNQITTAGDTSTNRIVTSGSLRSLSLDPSTMFAFKWAVPLENLLKIAWDESTLEELEIYAEGSQEAGSTVRTPRRNQLIGSIINCWREDPTVVVEHHRHISPDTHQMISSITWRNAA